MSETTLAQSWLQWGLALLFGLPVFIIIMNEVIRWLESRQSRILAIAVALRNWVLPGLFAFVFMGKVLVLPVDSVLLRLTMTFFWIILIHISLKLLNTVFFADNSYLSLSKRTPQLLVDFIRTFLILLGTAFVCSSVWGADLGRLLTALGVGSVVLGLALQDVLGGLFSGLALMSSSPFAVGDWIRINDVEGKVKDMDWRSVTLETRDRDLVVIPNALVSKEKFYNFSRPSPLHMERVGFDISFDDRPNKVKEVLLKAVKATPEILDIPAPAVVLVSYDEFSIHYEVQYFIEYYDQQPKIRNNFISQVWYLNRRYGITFPTRAHEVYQFNGTQVAAENTITTEQLSEQIQALQVLDLPAAEIHKLAEYARLEDYAIGEFILRQGQLAEYFYILMEGNAVEAVEGDQPISHRMRRGDFFGVTGMVRREPSPVNIIAEQDVKVMVIELEPMHKTLLRYPQIAQDMALIMERREESVRLVKNNQG